jgi:hypothetical protein
MMLKRTAKSCGSDAPGLASSLREEAQATVSNKPGHRGEREVSRKTIARGMPGDFRCDRGDYARVFVFIPHEAAGASSARHSLRPLNFRADGFCKNSDASRRENARSCLQTGAVIASEAKQSISPRGRNGLLRRFAPRNDGHTAIASKSFKPAKIYSLKPHCSAAVARRSNDADASLNRTSVVVPSPAEVRRSLNPSGDQPCPSALHLSRPPPLARWL